MLAQYTLDYLWLILFAGEDIVDARYAEKHSQVLAEEFATLTRQEKEALSKAAAEYISRLDVVAMGKEEKTFWNALATGKLFEEWK
jgi:hypothetical protein